MARFLVYLILTVCFWSRTTEGRGWSLGFVLNNLTYPNGSTVLRTDIGEGDDALLCTTDRPLCCKTSRVGEFFFPSGSRVHAGTVPSRTYYRNRGSGLIRLNRRPNSIETGQFHCEIPDANGTLMNLTINIVDFDVSITASGTNVAGETYSLQCSTTVTGSTEQPTITWLGPMNNSVPPGIGKVSTTNRLSILTFNPLIASHAGTYTCTANIGNIMQNVTVTITVQTVEEGRECKDIAARSSHSCSIEVGIAVGVIAALECFVGISIAITTTLICWSRKKADMIQSKVHENPDKLASSDQQGNYELTQCPAYVTTTEKPHPQIMEDQSNMYEL